MLSYALTRSPFVQVITNSCPKMLFAYVAAVLVQEYAIYAKHSGIPEIKTVLGGFVIRRFLGIWTLVTKSLGLVSSSYVHHTVVTYRLAVSCCGIGHVVGKRRPSDSRRLLLCKRVYEIVSKHQRQ